MQAPYLTTHPALTTLHKYTEKVNDRIYLRIEVRYNRKLILAQIFVSVISEEELCSSGWNLNGKFSQY